MVENADPHAVQGAVIAHANEIRSAQGEGSVYAIELLHNLAMQRAAEVAAGRIHIDNVDDALSRQLNTKVGELRIELCGGAITPETVSETAVDSWFDTQATKDILLGNWVYVGVGIARGCPTGAAEGVVVVMLMADLSSFVDG